MKSKAQVSIFIVLALILLLSASIVVYSQLRKSESLSVKETTVAIPRALELSTVKAYVETCISKVTLEPILDIASLGGSFSASRDEFKLYENDLFRYLCLASPGSKSCVNTLLLRDAIEFELAQETAPLIKSCINVSAFQNEGFSVQEGSFDLKVDILPKDIVFSLKYPLTFSKEDFTLTVVDYNKIMPLPLGDMYALAMEIINEEIQESFFNKDEWMVKNNVTIEIDKQRPYPDVIYTLKKSLPINRDIIFRFGLKYHDRVSQIGSFAPRNYASGCCKTQDACFKNAPENLCLDIGGTYNPNQACTCRSFPIIPESKQVSNCASTYEFRTQSETGPSRTHGESWCSYDSVLKTQTGLGGLAYVGSRSYKHSCIDGKEIIEPCTDYRDEFCTEKNENNLLSATCRKNRWEDCFKCNSEQCCKDESVRDCSWDESLETTTKCFPLVPPGFKFWEGNGAEVCNVGTTFKACEGFSCPSKWVDDSAVYCYTLGDCGNYRNIADDLTTQGYINTDPLDRPSKFIFQEPGYNINPREEIGPSETLQLDFDTRNQREILGDYPQPASTIAILFSTGIRYLDYLGQINPFDFFNPFKDPPKVKILDYSFCHNWQAPLGGDKCQLCHQEAKKPCSEYRCKSLGQLCNYETTFEGFGNCSAINFDDNQPPDITFDEDFLNAPFTALDSQITTSDKIIKGIIVTPRIIPYHPIKLAINTSEPTRCNLNYLPNLDLIFMSSFFFGDNTFSTRHNMSLRLPEGFSAPSKIFDSLNISSLAEIADIVFNLELTYNRYLQTYSSKFATIKFFTGIDVPAIMEPIKNTALAILQPFVNQFDFLHSLSSTLLTEIENDNYYLFVSCTDRAGNRNSKDFFIAIGINTTYNDTDPVEFINTIPDNTSQIKSGQTNVSLSLFINEPAECKWSFDNIPYTQMTSKLTCPSSPYQIDPFDGGSYRCDTVLPFVKNDSKYYFKCEDNPPQLKNYGLKFIKSNNFSLIDEPVSRYLNVTNLNTIEASADFIAHTPEFNVNIDQIDLKLFVDDLTVCRYSNNSQNFAEMGNNIESCTFSNDLDKGLYECTETLSTFENVTYNIACRSGIQKPRNMNVKPFTLNLTRSKKLKNIIISPELNSIQNTLNPELVVTLIKPISQSGTICGYNNKLGHGFIPMQKEGNFIYKAQLTNLDENTIHKYHINCKDNADNEFTVSTTFRVELGSF
tara:strand:+ start:1190 stop:4795 length:3606 start_codon:yes stop_codon:yes gene_type:complete